MTGILADRYASKQMKEIWSYENKILLERDLWIAVMKTQRKLGVVLTEDTIAAYEKTRDRVDLISIETREKILKHDVKARIEEFNELAGHESIHLGMTSRDLTENIELLQIQNSLDLTVFKSLSLLCNLGMAIESYTDIAIVARTHNVPAQVTTLGKRFATWAEELMFAIEHLQELRIRLPLRGIKGAVGTQQDAQDLIGKNISSLDREISKILGFKHVAESSSQVYPRSYDYEVSSCLVQVSAAATNMTTNIRLMSGYGLMREGVRKGQVGSTAMPHKVNARSSERVSGLSVILKGYANMIAEISGNQWGEGDVSCSVVRRVALPNAFYAIDAILDTSINILRNLVISKSAINAELEMHLPFMLSSKILMKLVEQGMGREEAHRLIKDLAQTAAANFSETRNNNFFELLSKEKSLGISKEFLNELLTNPLQHSGLAQEHSRSILSEIKSVCGSRRDILTYQPVESI